MILKRVARLLKEQKGFTFIEVLVGMAIMGAIVAAFMLALVTAFKANMIAQVRTTADSLARAQMEYIKSQPYGDDYTYFPTYPVDYYPKYSLYWLDSSSNEHLVNPGDTNNDTISPSSDTNGLQHLIILIKHNDNDILSLEGYKAER